MKTLAAVLEKIGEPLVIEELEIPPLREGQVLVEIAFSGLCHSQINEIKGLKGEDRYLPHTLGHEGSGIVLEKGPGVTKVEVGDSVVLSWIKGIGKEAGGAVYQGKQRKINSGPISTFLQKAVISENRIIPIPKEVPLREAALLGCAFPTGAGAIFNQMKLQPGNSLAIFGLGGLGLSALIAAKQSGAFPLIGVDLYESKFEKAKLLGATHTLSPSQGSIVEAIREITGGKGVDFAFECAGKRESMESAFQCVKAGSGLCIIAGNLPSNSTIQIDPFALIAGKRILGSWGGQSEIDRDVSFYSQLILQKRLHLKELISHETDLFNIQTLVKKLEAGLVGRGLIRFKDAIACSSSKTCC